MNEFIYKKNGGITALSATMTDFSYKKHAHEEYAIGVTKRGIQHYHLDGHLQLSYQNGIMLFNPEQTHDGMAHDNSGLEYIMLYIKPDLLLEAIEQKEIIRFVNPVIYNKNIQSHILKLAEAVFYQEKEQIIDELFIRLTESLVNYVKDETYDNQDSLIYKMKEKIYASLKEDLKIDLVANEFSMSKFQFIRFFKRQTGMTPYQFFLNSKIEAIRKQIEVDKDIYSAVNDYRFVDLTHLNRQFKRVYGVTANDYAKLNI